MPARDAVSGFALALRQSALIIGITFGIARQIGVAKAARQNRDHEMP
jgi:hypothetical protein